MITLKTGTWRSFKLFCFSGKIEMQDESNYLEISIDEAGNFSSKHSKNFSKHLVLQVDQWHIKAIKNRLFIYFEKKQVYELITMEPTIMVLSDVVKGEKIFFAKMPVWKKYIEPVQHPVRHIESRSEKKRKLSL